MSKPNQPRGRYRFQGGQPLDPNAGVHPEMATGQDATPVGTGIPNTPQELMAMQENKPSGRRNPIKSRVPRPSRCWI